MARERTTNASQESTSKPKKESASKPKKKATAAKRSAEVSGTRSRGKSDKKSGEKSAKKSDQKSSKTKISPQAKKPKVERRGKGRDDRPLILVTGASGGLGRLVCRKLHRRYRVCGLDRRPFPDRPKDIQHLQIDLRRKSAATAMRKLRPSAIIHLGVIHNPHSGEAFRFNLEGTAQLLRVAEKLGVEKFVYLSSANLYGPSATSSGFLTEEAPLLGAGRSPEIRDLISLDMMVQSFFWKRPQADTIILRPVHIVGPHLRNAPSKYFRLKNVPTLLGFDPMVQIIHELDLVDALLQALAAPTRGVFNVVGPGQAPLSRLIRAGGKKQLPIPGPFFTGVLDRMFRLHLTRFPSTELDHLRYSCLVDGARAKKHLGFEAARSLHETLADLE